MARQAVTTEMSDEQFDRHAMQILARELGPGGFARYLRLHRSGKGDYTAERHQWLAGVTIEDIAHELGITVDGSDTPSSSATPPQA